MIAASLALLCGLACCQALLAVALADRLSPTDNSGRGSAHADGDLRLA